MSITGWQEQSCHDLPQISFGYHVMGVMKKTMAGITLRYQETNIHLDYGLLSVIYYHKYNGKYYTESQYGVMMPDPLNIWQGNSHTLNLKHLYIKMSRTIIRNVAQFILLKFL